MVVEFKPGTTAQIDFYVYDDTSKYHRNIDEIENNMSKIGDLKRLSFKQKIVYREYTAIFGVRTNEEAGKIRRTVDNIEGVLGARLKRYYLPPIEITKN